MRLERGLESRLQPANGSCQKGLSIISSSPCMGGSRRLKPGLRTSEPCRKMIEKSIPTASLRLRRARGFQADEHDLRFCAHAHGRSPCADAAAGQDLEAARAVQPVGKGAMHL